MGGERLRLRAADSEDLAVIAACLQDARLPVREMAYSGGERRFMAAFTRYRREVLDDPTSCDGLTECLSVLVVDGVEEAKYRGIDPASPDKTLNLLTIATQPGRDRLIHIDLVFEGEARIQLRTDSIACRLDDFGDAVPCLVTPCDHFGGGATGGMPGWTESYDAPPPAPPPQRA